MKSYLKYLWPGMALCSMFFYPLISTLGDEPYYMHWKALHGAEFAAAWVALSLVFTAFLLFSYRHSGSRTAIIVLSVPGVLSATSMAAQVIRQLDLSKKMDVVAANPYVKVLALAVVLLIGLIVLVPQRQTLRNMLMKAALVFLFVISPLTLISLYTVAGASLWAGDRGAGETRADAVGDKPSLHPEGHVYLIIFDEMSYEYLYEEGTVKSAYPNFRAFSDMADNYHDAQAPGANTMTSIPALLNLKEGQRTKVIGDRLYLMEKGRAPLEFSPTPDNVFSTARAKGYGTALYGWYHDYCGIFKGLLDACRSYSIYNYSSSARGFSPLNAVFTNFNLWPYVFPAGYLKNLTAAPFHRNNAYSALGHALKTIDMEGSYFFFIHFGVPHNPFVFDAAGFNPPADPFNPSEKNYVNQLAYVDRIFGEFLERMREAGKLESSTIIVASDHNFRKRTPKERHKNVPLIVKRKGQGERMDFTEPALLISVVRETLAR